MEKVFSRDGTPIAFDRSGNGPAVILVGAAFQTRSDPMMSQLSSLLAPNFSVFNYDRRGRGDSGDTAPYAVDREIEDIEALIQEAGGSAYLYGISSGAVLALETASKLRAGKLALYEPTFIVDDSRAPLPHDYVEHLKQLLDAGQRGDAVEYFMTNAAGVPAEFVAQMRHAPFWQGMEAVAHTLVYDGTIIGNTMSGNPLPTDRWITASMPALVIVGGASAEHFHSGANALVNGLPDARLRLLEGQDHNVAPESLAPLLIDFFSN